MIGKQSYVRAYFAPFGIFLAFLFLRDAVAKFGGGGHWGLASPQYWVFPVQTFVCGTLLWLWRRQYQFRPTSGVKTGAAVGLLAFGVWISPQFLFHASPRLDGFDPEFFGNSGWPYWINLTLRLTRMVVVVPLLEEIFWRGFLLRYLVRDDFRTVPFGTFTWTSFIVTGAGFCLEHQAADWPAAAVTGVLYNLAAYRTRSLLACVVAHAVTNLALAIYLLQTRQWGFW